MALEAQHIRDTGEVHFTAAAALTCGEVIQLPDGRAGIIGGLAGYAVGDIAMAYTKGVYKLAKTASINLLDGGKVFWDRSASTATYAPAAQNDFYAGVAVSDSLAAATEVTVDLNVQPVYAIEFPKADWLAEATDGLGVVAASHGEVPPVLAFDAVAEVGQASLSPATARVACADGPIFEAKIAVFDIGDDGSLDINFGLANGSHGTDADSITEAVFFHLDGNVLNILAESDDGTTEVAATDTTVDSVDDTYNTFWIDCRDLEDIQLYIDGVNVLPDSTFKLDKATGPIYPIIHLEKTSNDTTADVRMLFMRVRTTDLT